jgi:hypothetical protein
MTQAQQRDETARTRGRLDQLLDDVDRMLAQIREELAAERRDREEGRGG